MLHNETFWEILNIVWIISWLFPIQNSISFRDVNHSITDLYIASHDFVNSQFFLMMVLMWWRPYPLKTKLTVIVIGGVIQKESWEEQVEPIHLLRMYKQSVAEPAERIKACILDSFFTPCPPPIIKRGYFKRAWLQEYGVNSKLGSNNPSRLRL